MGRQRAKFSVFAVEKEIVNMAVILWNLQYSQLGSLTTISNFYKEIAHKNPVEMTTQTRLRGGAETRWRAPNSKWPIRIDLNVIQFDEWPRVVTR